DAHTVVVELTDGSADFPYLLSDYHLAILPADGDRLANAESGVGTGGYVLADYEPG
nr:peptide ABC transporter substrate-binding protein [Desulfuromonadales bacterium]